MTRLRLEGEAAMPETYQQVEKERDALRAEVARLRPLPDHDNHHNALKCPYCNPRGLKFVEPVDKKDQKIKLLRSLLRKASGSMSRERWSTDFREEVRKALRYED